MRTTLYLDDRLVERAQICADDTRRTLADVIEDALRDALPPEIEAPRKEHTPEYQAYLRGEDPFGNGLPWPTVNGGGWPEGLDVRSNAAMLEFIERLEEEQDGSA